MFLSRASLERNSSTCTEWSITRSTGRSGLIFDASPPSSAIASRIAARSTTAGTPVKSCISTRAGVYAISADGFDAGSQSGDRLDVGLGDGDAVLEAEQVLEQHAQGERQRRDLREALGERRDRVVLDRPAPGLERGPCPEAVRHVLSFARV